MRVRIIRKPGYYGWQVETKKWWQLWWVYAHGACEMEEALGYARTLKNPTSIEITE